MPPTRRQYLAGTVTTLSVLGFGATAVAQNDSSSLAFEEINAEGEYLTIRNVSNETVDLSGYNVNLEVGQQVDQIPDEPFSEGTTLAAGETLTITTGTAADVEGDIDLGYQTAMINNTNPDVIGILNPDGEIIIRSDRDRSAVMDTSTSTSTDETTRQPTETTTETSTEAPTRQPTGTTAEPTKTTTQEPSRTPTEEPSRKSIRDSTTGSNGPTDSDGDGLTDSEETRLGTDPNDTDTDGDGWSDLSEVNRGCDPLDSSKHA